MIVKEYALLIDGKKAFNLKKDFPIYGQRNMKCSLCHMALDGRVIETLPMYKVCGREANHNDFNGRIMCVNFIPDASDPKAFEKFPTPSTTKVSFYPNCPKFQECMSMIKEICTNSTSTSTSTSTSGSDSESSEEPEPSPGPAPQPRNPRRRIPRRPVPQPAPEPSPEPAPQPAPEPAPQPAPQPTPQPAPEPSPEPSPIPPPPPATPIEIPRPNNPFTFTKSRQNEIVVLENETAIAKLAILSSTCADWVRILEKYSLEFGYERFKRYIIVQQQIADAFFE